MTEDRWAGVPDLLTRLEDLELGLLSWGVVDGFLSASEVGEAIEAQLDLDAARGAVLLSNDQYLEHLLDVGLLHQLPEIKPRYRTRLAETLRLLRSLRQLLPKDQTKVDWWRQSSPLVADFRLRVSPRRYPARSVTVTDLVGELEQLDGWTTAQTHVVRSVVGSDHSAKFQVQATRSILSALREPHPVGRIVTAGTGSGKTRAFYLPALLDIAATIDVARKGPHTLALYPRNELLRDQARETLRVITDLGPLRGAGSRPGRVGLLYGNTPFSTKDFARSAGPTGWRRQGESWIAPYFPCLDDDCGSHLVWTDADRLQGVERLVCPRCGKQTMEGTLALTRASLKDYPPDILFSSTEMLSKQSTDSNLAGVLGWKGSNGTRLVLLDEVHTYTGVHGAQVALMLRRWRYANRQHGTPSPVMVGLSATLRNAADFFADLTGVERGNVGEISPANTDLLPTSREYGIVLRGDPVSGASLLSTTIQTLMLLGRVLDTQPGIYGSVAFAFTDDLDVINRLHDNLRDAEGEDPRGLAGGQILADLRSPSASQAGARYRDGQSWDLPAHLNRMSRRLRVARTSSQDAGVDNTADIIVATSSLEVGFNDPRVGAVIQHKAPRDMASFLQRRGRAGRRLAMRPITAVVLSDYGRDRIAYQTYEKLLDPEIGARSLPIGNRFVIKIQATHALIDWITRRINVDGRWALRPPYRGVAYDRAPEVVTLLRSLLASVDLQSELAEHLRRSLSISADEAEAALREEPRSLLLSVLPTALRRLESGWTPLAGEVDPGAQGREPLPEFMTNTLFDSLNTPDVEFVLPFRVDGEDETAMPIDAALREAVPGRVRRRFGYSHASHRTWLQLPALGTDLALTDVIEKGHALGVWKTARGEEFTVVRPLVLRLEKPPPEVADSSSAQPLWRSAFEYDEGALHDVDIPTPSAWSSLVDRCAFALHVTGGPLRVRRMTIGSDGELQERRGSVSGRTPFSVRYIHDGQAAALGFEIDVDGMILSGRLPGNAPEWLGDFPSSSAWRTLAFRRRVLEDPRLVQVANGFQLGWLIEVYLHAYVSFRLNGGSSADATAALASGRWADNLTQFFAVLYRTDESLILDSRVLAGLRDLITTPLVCSVIEEHGLLCATDDLSAQTSDLLDRALADTLGCAVLTAVQECSPDAQDADLMVDIQIDDDRRFRVIISETSIGGLGLLESLHRDYALNPSHFWDAVARACSPTEAEDVDDSMSRLVNDLVDPNSLFAPAVRDFRSAEGIRAMDAALQTLLQTWTEHDGPPSHLLVSTFAARMLRPGSKPTIDQVVANLAHAWVTEETRLGVELDARAVVFHASQGKFGFSILPLTGDMAFSMLWLRGPSARSQRLEHWHPYRSDVVVERRIFDRALRDGAEQVDVTDPRWLSRYVEAVERKGRVVLTAPYPKRTTMAGALRDATVTPVERNGLRVYARVTAINWRYGLVRVHLSLAEDLQ
ncbi:DEAD/DEAH box helicase [Jatrophihabitans telluris]|uniref:DEAD/DEAH box helicase n=1 Tax=Jatrophihabitans telluris TaxID=2038343 RepID=A0ABY4QVI1_9ACTN|nr:protein DpdJ [Jatrophihabitans telluris]UQX87634.1 DEAD/DEAH box helicase [Jatrophihabitans telluris]